MATSSALDSPQLRAIHAWCCQRARQKIGRALEMEPYWLDRKPHEQIRCELGMTVDEYRRARRWLELAGEMRKTSREWPDIHAALREIGDLHVRNVIRYGRLRGRHTFEEIRGILGLSERELDLVAEWWRDAMAAVTERREVARA